MWKVEESKEVQKLPWMNLIENLNLKGYSFSKRMYGPTMLTDKKLCCVENWKWGIAFSKKVAQKIAEKSKNCEIS